MILNIELVTQIHSDIQDHRDLQEHNNILESFISWPFGNDFINIIKINLRIIINFTIRTINHSFLNNFIDL
jgi:hypothetical protein